jgi:anti-sigma B factor antagonist
MTCQRTDRGDETTLRIEGLLDAVSTAELRPIIESVVAEKRGRVIVDLSSLRLIDSSGVGAIVSLYKRVRADGGEVTVVGVRGQPLAIFRLLKLDRVFST